MKGEAEEGRGGEEGEGGVEERQRNAESQETQSVRGADH